MRLRILLAGLTVLLTGTTLPAQISGDALGVHNFGPGSQSPVIGARPDSCAYCHAPHSGLNAGLWNQKLTTQTYTMYSSNTGKNTGTQPVLGSDSNHCLSCHDGTVAVGETVAYGKVTKTGEMYASDKFGSNMQSSHPFSLTLPLNNNIYLTASLTANGKTGDPTGAVKLIKGNVECTSCHNPHIQATDLVSRNFLVKDSSSGQLCLACHDPSRQIGGQVNPLADWPTSAHAQSAGKIAPSALLGSYPTVATAACISCHAPHNAGGATRLLRGQDEQDCIACHNGSNVSPMFAYANVFPEYAAPKVGHPFPSSHDPHDAAESTLLNNNRHATCVDCHNAHGSEPVGAFPPAPLIRISQKNIAGISAGDGITPLTPAVNQYDNCLRCHGKGTGKTTNVIYGYYPKRAVDYPADPLNQIVQFALGASSSHPVMHLRNSTYDQTSLLPNMLNLDGVNPGRAMSTQILCTDCHNSDDNRESGGKGANGPHGSIWTHILERRYEFSQATEAGETITNPFPNPNLGPTGPYGLCAKCHDLANQITKNTSFAEHYSHIVKYGFSCSTCHTAHGMVAGNGSISGERLINFDVHVVAPNGGVLSYNRNGIPKNSCVLVCHGAAHNPGGGVTDESVRRGIGVKR